jgi:hypothetical protein
METPSGNNVSTTTPAMQDSTSKPNEVEIPHYNDLVEYLCTQKGSRMMQEKIKKEPVNSINLIIEKIKDEFGTLMSD